MINLAKKYPVLKYSVYLISKAHSESDVMSFALTNVVILVLIYINFCIFDLANVFDT